MARPRRKHARRTKSGRISRAYRHPEVKDLGTHEAQSKRHALVNGSDPQLAASASGILLANGYLELSIDPIEERSDRAKARHNAALRYAYCHAITFGRPWCQPCPLGRELGYEEKPDEIVERAKHRLAAMDAVLDPEQRRAVANLACFGFVPMWFYTSRLKLRPLPEDERERELLLSGLDALALRDRMT
jgi:hypothetical protein